jgi:hypothetical protein
VVPQSTPPPLLLPLELPLLEPLELPLLPPLLLPPLEPPLLLLALASLLLFTAGLLLLLQAVADTPATATVSPAPKTKVIVRMFIASTPFVCFTAPEVLPGGCDLPQEHGAHTKGAAGMVATSCARFFLHR